MTEEKYPDTAFKNWLEANAEARRLRAENAELRKKIEDAKILLGRSIE